MPDNPKICDASAGVTGAACERPVMDLRDQRALLASVLETLPLGVGIYDPDGNLIHSNERMRGYAGLNRLPSREPALAGRWRGYGQDGRPIRPEDYPGNRALRGEPVNPGLDFLYWAGPTTERWMRVSAMPFSRDGEERNDAVVMVQDVDDLKRTAERIEAARAHSAKQSRFLDATLSSIPDFVYAFDPERRFVYANPAMLTLFGLSADEILGRNFADLDYPPDLADELSGHIDRVLREGVTTEGEVYYRSPTGHGAYFDFLWGPVRADDGTVELVVGVSRDTTDRRAMEDRLKESEARLRAATDLVGLGIYSWNPVTNALVWDERVRELWGLPPGAPVDIHVFEAGICPDDLTRVRDAISACVDPAGNGRYAVEYRVIGRDDGVTRHLATSGRTTFENGRAVGFIGAVRDVTTQRYAEAAIRSSEAQFRGFAEHSRNLIWIGDPDAGEFIYRSAAFERIWGIPCQDGPITFGDWMKDVHPEDRTQVERALGLVKGGEAVEFEYRIIRPKDGTIRWLRDMSFPIRDEQGVVKQVGGITVDLSLEQERQVYIVSAKPAEARRLATVVRSLGHRARTFESTSAFLDIAPVLTPGCVLVDLRHPRNDGLSIPRELKARSIPLPTIALDAPVGGVTSAVAAMKAGAIDYIRLADDDTFRAGIAHAIAECHGVTRPKTSDDGALARLARLTAREREVLVGLVGGGTNKSIGQELGISPRTVELHRAQVMNRLNATSLTELLRVALAAGITPATELGRNTARLT